MDCDGCHGSGGNPAPPRALSGALETTDLGVGAHASHLTDSAIRDAVSCGECHVRPATVDAAGHLDAAPADLTFGELATMGGVEPSWDRQEATCADTYCHGATLEGGAHTAPVWTTVDDSQVTCGSCHGAPPPAPHPAVAGDDLSACARCHPSTVREDGTIDTDGGQHIDGTLDVVAECNACHGNEVNNAPPWSVLGAEDTDVVEVGAHQSHVRDSAIRAALDCDACHRVPQEVGDAGHIDGGPAELSFGALATTGALEPSWNREAATCADTYCHGANLSGGSATEPVWTLVDGSQAQCGSCHGAPPPPPHLDRADCWACHADTVREDGTIDVAGGNHMDGELDLTLDCSSCHGGRANNAPPRSIAGGVDTAEIAVGAHQSHLRGAGWHAPVACGECHIVPQAVGSADHIDPSPAEVIFGDAPRAGGLSPVWDREAARCSDNWCHGGGIAGGAHTTPIWTLVDGTQTGCDGCHGFPPPPPHPAAESCGGCHPALGPETHINGQVDLR